MFYPIPDAVYNILYQAKANVATMTLDTSNISWPYQYETTLFKWGKAYLEACLGEGKEADAFAFADKALSDYNFWMAGPDELRKSVRSGIKISGLFKGRRVNPWSTTPNSG